MAFGKLSERAITIEGDSSIEFDSKMSECVSTVLGRFGVPETLLNNMSWMYGLKNKEIPDKPELFEKCLDKIFGKGSFYLKKAITDQVKARFGLTEDNYSSLKELFEAAKQA
jgi:hypothetical protein